MTDISEPIILSIGGGKGGVGKSMISANFAIYCAQEGLRTALIDLDFGGANLHTLFGIPQPLHDIGNFFDTAKSKLDAYLQPTFLPNLLLGCHSGNADLANLKHLQKVKIVNHIKKLDADIVLLDLGAGSSYNVVDFFSSTQTGIIVTTPEPTATVNAYEFLKNVLFRILFRFFKDNHSVLEILKNINASQHALGIKTIPQLISYLEKHDLFSAEALTDICRDFELYLIFNQAKEPKDAFLGEKLRELTLKYLNLPLQFPGIVYSNQEVGQSVVHMKPILAYKKESSTSQTLRRIFGSILKNTIKKRLKQPTEPFSSQLSQTLSWAQKDYEENLLTQKKLARLALR